MDTNEKTQSGAGDVRSDATTIAALRQGVGIDERTSFVVMSDHNGEEHEIPVAVVELSGCITVEVSKDAIAEMERRASGPRRRTGKCGIPVYVGQAPAPATGGAR